MKEQSCLVLILLGPPGSGKGTQCQKIVEAMRIPHVSTGDILRDHVRRTTTLGKRVKAIMENGDLVPDNLVFDILGERITQRDCVSGFILDGFPRTPEQAESLDLYLSALDQNLMQLVIRLVVPQAALLKRLAARNICPSCGAGYSETAQPPRIPGKCDADGAALILRKDDYKKTALERLQVYEKQISPIVAHYTKHDAVLEIDGDRPVDDVTVEILRTIKHRSRMATVETQ